MISEDSSSKPAITEAILIAVFKSLSPFFIVLATPVALFTVSAIVRAVLATLTTAKVPVPRESASIPIEAAFEATLDLPFTLERYRQASVATTAADEMAATVFFT